MVCVGTNRSRQVRWAVLVLAATQNDLTFPVYVHFFPLLTPLVLPAGLHHDTSFQRHFNPMAGSFSAYSSTTTTNSSSSSTRTGTLVVTRHIRAGDELFFDRTVLAQTVPPAYVQELPLEHEYQKVDEMVQAIAREGFAETLTMSQFHDLLHRLSTEIIPAGFGQDGERDGRQQPPIRAAIVQQLFPRSLREFKRCLEQGSARYRLLSRGLQELEQHGMSKLLMWSDLGRAF